MTFGCWLRDVHTTPEHPFAINFRNDTLGLSDTASLTTAQLQEFFEHDFSDPSELIRWMTVTFPTLWDFIPFEPDLRNETTRLVAASLTSEQLSRVRGALRCWMAWDEYLDVEADKVLKEMRTRYALSVLGAYGIKPGQLTYHDFLFRFTMYLYSTIPDESLANEIVNELYHWAWAYLPFLKPEHWPQHAFITEHAKEEHSKMRAVTRESIGKAMGRLKAQFDQEEEAWPGAWRDVDSQLIQ